MLNQKLSVKRVLSIGLVVSFAALAGGCPPPPPPLTKEPVRSQAAKRFDASRIQKILIAFKDLTGRYIAPEPDPNSDKPQPKSDLSVVREIEHEFVLSLNMKGYETLVSSSKAMTGEQTDVTEMLKDTAADSILVVTVGGPTWNKGLFNSGMFGNVPTYDSVEVRLLGTDGGILWTAADAPGGKPTDSDDVYRQVVDSSRRIAQTFPEKGGGSMGGMPPSPVPAPISAPAGK